MSPPGYPERFHWNKPFPLTLGGQLPELHIAYETWGRLNEDKSNAILLFTGLSASSHAKSHGMEDKPGWWEGMIEAGGGLDTDRYFIICLNHLGGCFGSTGPASINPATGKPYGPDFPPIMIQDLAVSAFQVVRHLGIETLYCAMGASMGGMLALEYAARYADEVRRVIMISASGRPGPQSIAYRYVQRQVILCDPTWAGGWYYDKEAKPDVAMAVARQIGNITYRSAREFRERFGRSRTGQGYSFGPDFQIESYLNHMGYKLASHFDANCFLFLSKAMDLYSLGHGFSSYETGVARIRAKTLIIGVSTDLLFPVDEQEEVYEIMRKQERDVTFELLESTAGHDAFLVEVDYFREKIRTFLAKP